MITNPIAFGAAIFFAVITVAPKRPGFGENLKDYLAIALGAILASIFAVYSVAG